MISLSEIKEGEFFRLSSVDIHIYYRGKFIDDDRIRCVKSNSGDGDVLYFNKQEFVLPLDKSISNQKVISVLRVEIDGRGIFMPPRDKKLFHQEIEWRSIIGKHYSFPTPDLEDLDLWKDDFNWFCGYKDTKTFSSWIDLDEMRFLANYGFNVVMYDVNQYQLGDYQILFTREGVVSQKNVTSLFI